MLRILMMALAATSAGAAPVATSSTAPVALEPVDADPFTDFATPAAEAPARPAPATVADPAPGPAPSEAGAATEPASSEPVPAEPLAAASAPAPRSADGLYLGPYARLSGLVVSDESFAAVAAFGALVRLEAGLEVAPFGAARGLAVEAGLGLGIQEATSFDAVQAQLVVTSLQAGVVYRQPLVWFLGAYGRVTGSANIAHLRLAQSTFGHEVDQVAIDGAIGPSAGLELAIPLGYTPQGSGGKTVDNYLAFFVEGGYELHSDLQFDAARRGVDADTEPARIPIANESLGSLNLTGWTWRFGGSFRF